MTDNSNCRPSGELTEYRLASIEETLASINETLRTLTSLEAKHVETRSALERSFSELGRHDERLRAIELELPTLKLIRGWVIAGVLSCVSMLGITVFKVATIAAQ